MARILYELAGADEQCRFSQHCWRVRLALHRKGLDYEGRPWRFTEKDEIAFADTTKVPVLVDGDRTIHDSWSILEYLERDNWGRSKLSRPLSPKTRYAACE